MGAVLVPVTADRACLSLTPRTIVHASVEQPLQVANRKGGAVRTVCGSDAFPVVHGVANYDGVMMAAWPPPVEERCTDCARLLGLGNRQRSGHPHWQELVPA